MTKADTHFAARSLVTRELELHCYKVSGTEQWGDLAVIHPSGIQFRIHVQGNLNTGSWYAAGEIKPAEENLFCILVVVNDSRFFILDQVEFNTEVRKYAQTHHTPPGGFNWGQALRFENQWNKLPGWTSDGKSR